jgi:hypothetical protein
MELTGLRSPFQPNQLLATFILLPETVPGIHIFINMKVLIRNIGFTKSAVLQQRSFQMLHGWKNNILVLTICLFKTVSST